MEEKYENFGEKIASALHEDWRQTRKQEDGTFEPRWKKIKDQDFVAGLDENNLPATIRKVEGGYEMDIANTPYEQLSPDWQAENKAAGYVVGQIISANMCFNDNEIGDMIHQEWLKRNEWGQEDPVLSKPYAELPKEEQDKDLRQYYIGKEVEKEIIRQRAKDTEQE